MATKNYLLLKHGSLTVEPSRNRRWGVSSTYTLLSESIAYIHYESLNSLVFWTSIIAGSSTLHRPPHPPHTATLTLGPGDGNLVLRSGFHGLGVQEPSPVVFHFPKQPVRNEGTHLGPQHPAPQ